MSFWVIETQTHDVLTPWWLDLCVVFNQLLSHKDPSYAVVLKNNN